jgi:hypothetical protein
VKTTIGPFFYGLSVLCLCRFRCATIPPPPPLPTAGQWSLLRHRPAGQVRADPADVRRARQLPRLRGDPTQEWERCHPG